MSRTATAMALDINLYDVPQTPVITTRQKRARTFRVVEFTEMKGVYSTIVYCLTPGQALKSFRDATSPKLASTLVSQMRKHGYAFVSDTATIYGRP